MGNNLFQYAVARIISENLGFELKTSFTQSALIGKNKADFHRLMSAFNNAPVNIAGKAYFKHIDHTIDMASYEFDGFSANLHSIIENKEARLIRVNGFFERYEIIQSFKDLIKEWYRIDPLHLGYDIQPDDIVIHIRRGDFVVVDRALSLDYYTDILKNLDYRKLYICGVGLDNNVKTHFKKFKPTYVLGDPVKDFRFMKGFNRIIQSQSTFSWWSGFLSDAEEIHSPIPNKNSSGFHQTFQKIDLKVTDENRYHYTFDVKQSEKHFGLNDLISSWPELPKHQRRHFALSLIKHWSGIKS
ncbi:MAG: alpha-1,2-fucosyltransferase [Cyclobacteriaceae bacterium]